MRTTGILYCLRSKEKVLGSFEVKFPIIGSVARFFACRVFEQEDDAVDGTSGRQYDSNEGLSLTAYLTFAVSDDPHPRR